MKELYYKLRLKWLLWYRERQIYDPKIDVIDAQIWYCKCRLSGGENE